MIIVDKAEVTIGISNTLLNKELLKIDKNATIKAEIVTDLTMLFSALVEKYDKPQLAEMIEQALKLT